MAARSCWRRYARFRCGEGEGGGKKARTTAEFTRGGCRKPLGEATYLQAVCITAVASISILKADASCSNQARQQDKCRRRRCARHAALRGTSVTGACRPSHRARRGIISTGWYHTSRRTCCRTRAPTVLLPSRPDPGAGHDGIGTVGVSGESFLSVPGITPAI